MAVSELIAESAERIASGDVVRISVRDFISHWGAERRGYRMVNRIKRDLGTTGLVTVPEFDETGIDALIEIRTKPKPKDEPEREPREYGLPIGTLPSATSGVLCVTPDDSLQLAYTRMEINDYSQMPVMTGERSVKGAVTWRSIAEALLKNRTATLRDAIVKVEIVTYDEDLLDLVSEIIENEFVLVSDQTGKVTGLVTTADLSELFAERAVTFLQLSEIDQRLRDVIATHFSIEEVRDLSDKGDGTQAIDDFDDLSMGDYEQVLANPDCWARLNWPLDRKEFHHLLDEVRDVRNDVLHFNPDPIEPERLSRVAGLVDLLRNHT
jgi:CBS domain-containing protein